MRLSASLQKWVNNKIITPEQSAAILKFETQSGGKLFWKTAFIIAGMLIGLGVCLIIAANWDRLPESAKIIGDFIVFATMIYGAYRSIRSQEKHWQEFFLIMCFLMVGATIGLIGQIYNLNGGWRTFTICWSLLSLPYVVLSRLISFNIIWMGLFCNIFSGELLEKILTYVSDNLDGVVVATAILCLLSYAGKKLDEAISSRIMLPKAFSVLSILVAYLAVFWGGLFWGLGKNGTILQSWLAHAWTLVFLLARMIKALKEQDVQSFKRNTAGMEIYIFILFASRFGDLLTSGIGFIFAGGLILALIYILKRTTAYIKGMEIFK